jgi:predicted nucleic acid-binding protein
MSTQNSRKSNQYIAFAIGGRAVKIHRRVEGLFHLDANRINSKQQLPTINRMENWWTNGVIMMELSVTAHKECSTDIRSRRAAKANEYIYAIPADWRRDLPLLAEIERIIFPDGTKTDNQRRDVMIVYTAAHYNAILVTDDGESKRQPRGLLGSRADLWTKKKIRVMSDEEAIQHVETLIDDRDRTITGLCQSHGKPLPPWVGAD